jgi:2Fe-2S ferredoxin
MKDVITLYVTDLLGSTHEIEAPTDMSLNVMEAMKANGLQVKATCGGMAMCATCNIRVLSDHPLPEMSEDEEAMLDEAFVLDDEGSRLSCQIPVSEEIDGLRVQLGELTSE